MPARKTGGVNVAPTMKEADASSPPQVELATVSSLRPHPEQSVLVGNMPPVEFEALVADIKAHGIQNPLIILADGKTIVCGHQRCRAAAELGFKQVPCIVRRDLRDPGDPIVIKLLLSDNLRRRQLGPLEKARYTKKLFEIESGRPLDPDCYWDHKRQIAVRDSVGKLLGCSGRNAARYLAVLNTPTAIQQAFDVGLLPLAITERISFLKPEVQQKLAESISKARSRSKIGSPKIKQTVQAFVNTALDKARPPKRVRPPSPSAPLYELKRCLEVNVPLVREGSDQIIAHIGGTPEPHDSPLFVVTRDICLRPVIEVRDQCACLQQLLSEIEKEAQLKSAIPECTDIEEHEADP
jgi:ParB-like chromosome segregation protein Spo0J